MALSPKLTNLAANTSADAVCALVNTGWLRIYDGAQPANADAPVASQVLLAELRFGAAAFAPAVAGVANANAIAGDLDINAAGQAGWFRTFKADGTTPVFDGSVGLTGCDLNLSSVTFVLHGSVNVSSLSYQQPKG
jgi:hypothetical protein